VTIEAIEKACAKIEDRLGAVAVRAMPAAVEESDLDVRDALCDRVELGRCPVLVFDAL
jgi:hypothetical protein